MSRIWLLLLAIVMPLQMSWAAVHFCSDDAAGTRAEVVTASADMHGHAHVAADAQAEADIQGECCAAAHGCHGLHNLMATEQAQLSFANLANAVPVTDDTTSQRQFATRHERPQWSAA